jgi:hypothetical protein
MPVVSLHVLFHVLGSVHGHGHLPEKLAELPGP